MDHDLRYDADATQYDLPAVPTTPAGKRPDCTVWMQTVEQRLARLEAAVERIADALQALMLRQDDGK